MISKQHKTFHIGQRVRKKSRSEFGKKIGAEWEGYVVGIYSTTITPEGYAVESCSHAGSVQIYPVAALEAVYESDSCN